jgi:hypothetical protein
MINQVSNSTYPGALLPTCDNAKDNYQETVCPASATIKIFNPAVPRGDIGFPTCIEMTKYTFDQVMARYQQSDVSCVLLRSRFSMYRRFYEKLTGPKGVIEMLRFYLMELLSLQ